MSGFFRILRSYGKTVTIFPKGATSGVSGLALLQPVSKGKDEEPQCLPTELGVVLQERFLYFGEAGLSLENMEGERLFCDGTEYRIHSPQAIYLGRRLCYWRAMLSVREAVE